MLLSCVLLSLLVNVVDVIAIGNCNFRRQYYCPTSTSRSLVDWTRAPLRHLFNDFEDVAISQADPTNVSQPTGQPEERSADRASVHSLVDETLEESCVSVALVACAGGAVCVALLGFCCICNCTCSSCCGGMLAIVNRDTVSCRSTCALILLVLACAAQPHDSKQP